MFIFTLWQFSNVVNYKVLWGLAATNRWLTEHARIYLRPPVDVCCMCVLHASQLFIYFILCSSEWMVDSVWGCERTEEGGGRSGRQVFPQRFVFGIFAIRAICHTSLLCQWESNSCNYTKWVNRVRNGCGGDRKVFEVFVRECKYLWLFSKGKLIFRSNLWLLLRMWGWLNPVGINWKIQANC